MLLETATTKLLIDCGMFQGERVCGRKNFDDFEFDPKQIDAVVVTHPHLDHTGRLPRLIDLGFSGKIYMTEPGCALSKIVMEDAFHVMTENAERCQDKVLYDLEDLKKTFTHCHPVGYHEAFEVGDMSVMLHEAGHVLGSAYISVEAEGKRVVFSGDIGNDNVPILNATEPISRADVVVCESTYGGRVHEPIETRRVKLREVVEKTITRGGALLIPAFSIERTQELLYELNNMLPSFSKEIPIFLDSPLAIRATELYRHYKTYLHFDHPIMGEKDRDFFSFPGLHETLDVKDSKHIHNVANPKIIIAGSGMMTGGRILHHLIDELPNPKSMLLVIGYVAHGTLGRLLYEGAKKVRIFGKEVQVKADVEAIGAFSAHGDMNKLTTWIQPVDGKMPKVFLVHGDPEAKELFATHLRHHLKTEVVIPEYHEAFTL